MIRREPNDPAWYKGGLWHDNMKINVPGFWFIRGMTFRSVQTLPLQLVRKTARPDIANQRMQS